MLYTVGRADLYDPQMRAGVAVKLGRRTVDGVVKHGGWVWQSADDARRFLTKRAGDEPRKVYVVLAEWHLDTYDASGEPTRCLLRDAHIIGEVPG